MTLEEWLAFLPQVATWVTVLLVLFTFLEMVRQRKSTYRPDVVVGRLTIYGFMNDSLLPNLWLEKDLESLEQANELLGYPGVRLHAHNLGLGAAREVDFTWDVDIEKMIEDIRGLRSASEESVDFTVQESGLLMLEFGREHTVGINTKVDLADSVDFILPASIDGSGYELRFPLTYVDLASIKLKHEIRILRDNPEAPRPGFDFEPLRLRIRYKDIGGSKHSKEIRIEPSLIGIRFREFVPGSRVFSAVLDVK